MKGNPAWLRRGWLRRQPLGLFALILVVGYLVLVRPFGQTQVISWAVANRKIAVDPGHGGPDPGAVGPGGSREKDITLGIGLQFQRILTQAGALVTMTRVTDQDLGSPGRSSPLRKTEDLRKRLNLVKESESELYISIQANALQSRWTGAQTFYFPGSPEGIRLARSIQAQLRQRLNNTKRVAMSLPQSFMLKNLSIPAAMVEVGFISNQEEEKLLNNASYQEKIAWAIYAGVVSYLSGDAGGQD